MTLSTHDLQAIRTVFVDSVNEAFEVLAVPRFDAIERTLDEHTATLAEHTAILNQHSAKLDEHSQDIGALSHRLDAIEGRLSALESDVKELYHLVADLQLSAGLGKRFDRLTPEEKVVALHRELLGLAKKMGIELPPTSGQSSNVLNHKSAL